MTRLSHRTAIASLSRGSIILLALAAAGREAVAQTGYTSPFSITLDSDIATWTSDFPARRAAIDAHTSPPRADWYAPGTVYSGSSYPYGPLNPQLYSSASIGSPATATALQFDRGVPVFGVTSNAVPGGVDETTWKQQRILAAAQSLLQAGTPYQHLHLPDFDPAQVTSGTGFPWLAVSNEATLQSSWQLAHGQSGTTPNPGIDCTDFSALVYNLALGIQMHSGTMNQLTFPGPNAGGTATAQVLGPTGETLTPNFLYGPNYGNATINQPGSLDATLADLEPGDLLYMQGDLQIKHVVMWLGEYGTNADGTPSSVPLIISSHDNTPAIFDVNGTDQIDLATGLPTAMLPDGSNATDFLPPPGVHILPFTPDTWFYQNFTVAMQVVPEPAAWSLLTLAAPLVAFVWSRGKKWR